VITDPRCFPPLHRLLARAVSLFNFDHLIQLPRVFADIFFPSSEVFHRRNLFPTHILDVIDYSTRPFALRAISSSPDPQLLCQCPFQRHDYPSFLKLDSSRFFLILFISLFLCELEIWPLCFASEKSLCFSGFWPALHPSFISDKFFFCAFYYPPCSAVPLPYSQVVKGSRFVSTMSVVLRLHVFFSPFFEA